MSSKKKSKVVKARTVAEKLEAVQMKQRGLTIKEIKAVCHVSNEMLYKWIKAYEDNGIAGLEQTGNRKRRGEPSAKVQAAEQIIEQVRQAEPQGGVGKAQGALQRHGLLSLARETVRKLLRRKGIGPVVINVSRRNKPKAVKQFERATPNEMWQTDIMSFMIKGQYRVYLIGFMDDHSRFLLGWGLYRFQTAANVQEVFRAAIEKHGMPKEVLSDNGRQYYTWRGKSAFTTMLTKLGIRHIRSRPYHPQTLGKIESFWRNLYQECLSQLPLSSFEEAREKIGTYIEYYNFKRPHQGIGNLTPSDRFYRVGGQVKQIIEQNTARVEEHAPPLSDYTPPAYLVGNLGGKELRVVAKSAEVTLTESGHETVLPRSDGREKRSGGCQTIPEGENVSLNSNASPSLTDTEAKNGSTQNGETIQPAGTVGIDSSGDGASTTGSAVMSTSGGLPRIILPVDETGETSQLAGAGSEGAGAQNNKASLGDEQTPTADTTSGEGNGPAPQEPRPSDVDVSGGAADHSAASVGADPSRGG